MSQNVPTAFDKLSIDCSYATGDRFHRLEDRIQYRFFQLPTIERNVFLLKI